MTTLGIEAINATVELSEKGKKDIYRGKLLTPIIKGQPVRVLFDPTHEYYVATLKRVMESVGGDFFVMDSGDNRRFYLKIIELEKENEGNQTSNE